MSLLRSASRANAAVRVGVGRQMARAQPAGQARRGVLVHQVVGVHRQAADFTRQAHEQALREQRALVEQGLQRVACQLGDACRRERNRIENVHAVEPDRARVQPRRAVHQAFGAHRTTRTGHPHRDIPTEQHDERARCLTVREDDLPGTDVADLRNGVERFAIGPRRRG